MMTTTTALPLDRADFFELHALQLKVEHAKLMLDVAQSAATAKLRALAVQHGFDPQAVFMLDEATCSLRMVREAPRG